MRTRPGHFANLVAVSFFLIPLILAGCRPSERGRPAEKREAASGPAASEAPAVFEFSPSSPALIAGSAGPGFFDGFDGPALKTDPEGASGWAYITGEGKAVMDFAQGGAGLASITVDAAKDRRNVWWAVIARRVSGALDLALLEKPDYAIRVEARIRTDTAPRRVNLSVNTQRTTDFHSNLMEYDLPAAGRWETISFTVRGFDARPGDTVNAQMALMDWGLAKYRVDVDYFRADIVNLEQAGPDKGDAVPYHPPVADPASFAERVPAFAAATVDAADPDVNLGKWFVADAGGRTDVVTAGGTQLAILRWNLAAYAGKSVEGSGLLELTTRSLERTADEIPDFGLVRVSEIIGGAPAWERGTVTYNRLLRGSPVDDVIVPQMIIDWPVTEAEGGKTLLTISRPVLQRLIDGRTLGIAVRPLGAINASFYPVGSGDRAPRLLFSLGSGRGKSLIKNE